MADHDVTFNANPTQRLFVESKPAGYDEHDANTWGRQAIDLFSCRMGEGKTAGLVWSCFYHTMHNPGAHWLFIRDTWLNCRDTTQVEFFEWFKPGVFGEYKVGEKAFYWSLPEMGGGKVTFIGLDEEKDAAKLQSRPFAGFAIDEPSPAAGTGGVAEMIFTTALTRLRQRTPERGAMKWYAAKLAQNNPDESHWTYQRFVEPGTEGYNCYQTNTPENRKNLPPAYYEDMEKNLAGREDLKRRFIKGEYGFQQLGKAVTPNWSDAIHLSDGLKPVDGVELVLLWDFGQNATCVITQITPLGYWNVLESFVGDGMGTYNLIEEVVKPALNDRYHGGRWRHIGDPNGRMKEQSNSNQSAVKVIKSELGGSWKDGEVDLPSRINPLNALLTKTNGGVGVLRVDRYRAKHVWHALRGGWHFKVMTEGVVSQKPVKDRHSHPGDAMGYGAARLFPLGRLQARSFGKYPIPGYARYGSQNRQFIGRKGIQIPEAEKIPGGLYVIR